MGSPFVTGLFHPLNLAMLGLAAFAGLVAAWWLFPLGLLLWLVMVVAISRDPSLRFSHERRSRKPIARRFQPYFERVERAQVRIFNSLASAPARTRRALQPVQEELDTLTKQVHILCRRLTALENYRLVTESRANLEADLQQITESIDRATSERVKEQYEDSRRALLERIAKFKLVVSELDRVEAQLLGLANELDGTVTEIIHLQSRGPEQAADRVPALVQRIAEQRAELEQAERDTVDL